MSIAVGKCDRPFPLASQDSYIAQLDHIAQEHVIIYDLDERCAWLIDGASALLHLVRASLQRDAEGLFKSRFLFDDRKFKEPTQQYSGRAAAIEALTDESNQALKIFPNPPKRRWEKKKEGSRITTTEIIEESFECLQDRVERIVHILDQAFTHQKDTNSQDGIGFRVSTTQRRLLEGFDFHDIVSNKNSIQPYFTKLKHSGKGWVDFSRAIHAVTLFGRGFGQLIKPTISTAINSNLCSSWNRMPSGQDNLAVCVYQMNEIMQHHGSPRENTCRVVDQIYWHSPDKLFQPCHCDEEQQTTTCDRVQVLLPVQNLKFKNLRHPGVLNSGAVIFGHSWKFPLRWKEQFDEAPEIGNPDPEEPAE